MFTSLNINIEPHKYLEIIKGGDKVIVLYSDDGSTIAKETHNFTTITSSDVKGFLEQGMMIETITTETATGNWDQRYELEFSFDVAESGTSAIEENGESENLEAPVESESTITE